MRPSAIAAALLLSTAAIAAPPPPTPQPAPVAELVRSVDIPFEQFTLPNGLRVVVHEDRKAPVVAVSVWYHVGSRFEPKGKTGFAHLFEHLMFNGSENADDEYFRPLDNIGATDVNGTTWFDRTNYFQTVPTGALDVALFLESDRMGHLLGAVTQKKLDNQRGVVQNEKRQGDNQPYGLVEYAQLAAHFPPGHPYRHSTIGSMADLDAATLEDVKSWFREHYGPNNAVLVLAGDIDAKTARPMVEKWFGGIARGPAQNAPAAPVTPLAAEQAQVMHDRVATTRIYRSWTVPGLNDPDTVPLQMAAAVLGGLSSSRLDNALVRKEKLAVGVSAGVQVFEKVGLFEVSADVRPGADAKQAAARLDALIADLLRDGSTADEVSRVATRTVSGEIAGLEKVGGFSGKAVTLAEGALYSGDPAFYRKQLAAYAAATPASIAGAARKWLSKPSYRLTVEPGERTAADIAVAGSAVGATIGGPRHYRDPKAAAAAPAPAPVDRSKLPPVTPVGDLKFPDVERTTLSNGIKLVFARRSTVPTVQVSVSFDAGNAADPKDKLGTQALMLSLLDEGTKTRDSIRIAEEQERLGASIGSGATMDRTDVSMFALKPNLAPSLDLLADIVRNPAFDAAEVERLRATLLARIASEKTQPIGLARHELPPLLYGAAHPYGVPFTGSGTEAGVKAVTRDDLVAFHQRWLRPDTATIFAVGDIDLAALKPLLEARFGDWRAPATAKGAKLFRMDRMARPPRIVLIDRPQSPQSMILAGQLMPVKGTDDPLTLETANQALGGGFISRLNTELRETKGWSYGVSSGLSRVRETMPFLLYAPVQTDRTGDAIAAIRAEMTEFLTIKGTTAEERDRIVNSAVLSLPGGFETSASVLGALQRIAYFDLPDDYYEVLPARYRALTIPELDKAARAAIRPADLIWVVVGDAKQVRPQLDRLGMPVEVKKAE
jgi:predicted Zn-dependent peptidase